MPTPDPVYVSVDIETDGPVPGLHSMRSVGAVAFYADGRPVEDEPEFYRTISPLPEATEDERTMREFWQKHPDAWIEVNTDRVEPKAAIQAFRRWVHTVAGKPYKPVFVGYPVTFDFGFVHWYMHRFGNHDPFGFAGLDIKSYAAAKLGTRFHDTWKGSLPEQWMVGAQAERPHHALDDARAQACIFINMLSLEAP